MVLGRSLREDIAGLRKETEFEFDDLLGRVKYLEQKLGIEERQVVRVIPSPRFDSSARLWKSMESYEKSGFVRTREHRCPTEGRDH